MVSLSPHFSERFQGDFAFHGFTIKQFPPVARVICDRVAWVGKDQVVRVRVT